MMKKRTLQNQSGSIIVSILIVTIFLTILVSSMLIIANSTLVRARSRVLLLQAQYSAESGADTAVAQFNNGNESYSGSGGEVQVLSSTLYKSTFSTVVSAGSNSNEKIITSIGRVYQPASSTIPKYTRKIEVTAQRSTADSSSSMLSRNIMDIASGVKNIWATDIYINGYINMNKNTTNLIAENITVAGKNTNAGNCSIGGAGALLKPSSFVLHPTQTKTNITVAYNNCISPPSNTSTSDFNVTANTPLSTISSTYIPWSAYIPNTATNAGSCNDWTGNGSHNIPSTAGADHYPDSGSNVASTCGTSGNLDLNGTFNISENVHLRANLCMGSALKNTSSDACSVTFNNPTSSIKFIFVEGSVNFQGIQTVNGSGPLVLITYGADPNTHGSACPSTDGDSIYLGQQGNNKTIAPDLYLLAKNGLCIDQVKFDDVNASLGGVSGKNLYIAANSGNPFDLKLDPSFPVSQIPVNLSWRAVRYRRIN